MRIANRKIPTFYLLLFLMSVVLFALFQWVKPREVSWDETYASNDKMPYGTYILFNQLQDIFPNKTVVQNSDNYYDLLYENNNNETLIIINDFFETDKYAIDAILDYVSRGNEVFISAEYFDQYLLDTFNLKTNPVYVSVEESQNIIIDGEMIETIIRSEYGSRYITYFENVDSSDFIPLAFTDKGGISFIKLKHGDGTLFMHSIPIAFTNFCILKNWTTDFAEKSLSHLAVNDVIWDNYIRRTELTNRSDLSFIASSPALRSAYYIGLFLLIFFMVFYGKRRQKMIPVITPLQNSSLEFAETISKLYLQQNKHKDIAEKQIMFFKDFIRLKYHLQPDFENEKFKKSLSLRSGKDADEVNEISSFIFSLQNKKDVTASELFSLNKKIENFKKL